MKLGYAILYVQSVADTVAFYEEAFGLERGMVTPTYEYGELKTGATTLAFASASFVRGLHNAPFGDATPSAAAPAMEIGLVTEDVEGAFTRATQAGAATVKPPERKPWGQLVGYVRDSNGFIVELCSPMGG
ncbi:MAG TPA: VOC family protein [Caulobacteraceae bacterium]|nr:VOC family protein [Caulobacteraceae bacterium]